MTLAPRSQQFDDTLLAMDSNLFHSIRTTSVLDASMNLWVTLSARLSDSLDEVLGIALITPEIPHDQASLGRTAPR